MPRGESLGDAYVRVHADGSGLAREVKDSFDDLDPAIRGAARDNSDAYNDVFAKEMQKNNRVTWAKITNDINKALGKVNAQADFIDLDPKNVLRTVRERLEEDLGPEIGSRISASIRDSLQRGAIEGAEGVRSALRDLRPLIAKALDDITKEEEAAARERERISKRIEDMQRRQAARLIKIEQDRVAEQERISKREADALMKGIVEASQRRQQVIKGLRGDYADLEKEIERLTSGHARWGESLGDITDEIRRLRPHAQSLGRDVEDIDRNFARMRLSLIRLTPRIDATGRAFNGMADRIGSLTGRGSRNNFLNFVGSTNRALTRMFTTITIGSARAVTQFVKMAKALPEFIGDPALFKEAGKSLLSFASKGVEGLVSLVITIGVAVTSIGVLAAALSGLAAIVTSLAATIGFALVGAVGALAASLAPLVGAIGVVVGAFASLSDAEKEALKADLRPLTDSLKGLGDAAADVLFRDVGDWARQLAPVLRSLEPTVRGIATSIRTVLGRAVDGIANSDGFRRFRATMERALPQAVESLGNSMTNVFGGIGGVFRALASPGGLMERFLGWLEGITQEFSNWANSGPGQQELRRFFQQAGDSAASFGEFLKQAGRLLGELLSQARGTGDEMFRNMASAIQDMVRYLTSPEGKAAVADWLEFGQDFARSLGDAIVAIGRMFAALDNPTNRKILTFLVDMVRFIAEGFADLANGTGGIKAAFASMLSPIQGFLSVIDNAEVALNGILNVARWLLSPFTALGNMNPFSWLDGAISGLGSVLDTARDVGDFLNPFNDGGSDALGKTIQGMSQLAIEQLKMKQSTEEWNSAVEGLIGTYDSLTGAITGATRLEAVRLLEEQLPGVTQQLQDFGFTARQISQAAVGNDRVLTGMAQAIQNNSQRAAEAGINLDTLRDAFGNVTAKVREGRQAALDQIRITQNLGFLYRSLPKRVATQIDAQGIIPTTRGIARLKRQYDLTPRQVRTIIQETGADTSWKKVQRLLLKLRETGKQRPKPKVDAETSAAEKAFERLERFGIDLDKTDIKPKADLDDAKAKDKGKDLERLVRQLNGMEIDPTADLKTGPFDDGISHIKTTASGLGPYYVDIYERYHPDPRNPKNASAISDSPDLVDNGSNGFSGNTVRAGQSRTTLVENVNVYDVGDPAATTQEILNQLAALSY